MHVFRAERKEDVSDPTTGDGCAGAYDGFSETQTESQVCGHVCVCVCVFVIYNLLS